MLKLKLFVVSFLVLGLAISFASPALAQTTPGNFDATVSPVFFDFTAKPGTTVNGKVRLRNNTGNALPIKIEVKKMGGDQNGELTIQNAPDDTSTWFTVKNTGITAPSNEWITVPFDITVPSNAAYGYYWALSFTQDDTSDQKVTGTKLNAAIVVPVLLNVNREGAKTEVKISDFSKDAGWYEYLPVNFKTTVANVGNVHVRPKGNIFIKDFLGRTVATLDVNPNDGAILPSTKRTYETLWNDSFMWYENKVVDGKNVVDKNGKPKRELKVRFDKILDLRIGKYTATTLIVVNNGTRDIALEKSISFFVFPWKIVVGSIIFILFALLGIVSTAKTIGRRVMKLFGRNK